jgi:putative tricarboxylic transport membrane protein
MFDGLYIGAKLIFQWYPILLIFGGTAFGILAGCIPGFTIMMAMVIALPFTFGMSSINGLALMIGIMVGGLGGGQISGILLGIPGTPSSVATVFDGYPMTKKGKPGVALATGTWASFLGGIISAIILIFFMPPLAKVALKFGPWEFFSMVMFGLTMIASLSGSSVKGFISGGFGLAIMTFGTDPMSGIPRFTFGSADIAGGFSFLPILIGMFAFSVLLKNIKKNTSGQTIELSSLDLSFSSKKVLKNILRQKVNVIRSTAIGTFVGALPGSGSSLSNILSYDQARKFSKHPEKFGTGISDGIVASEAANNGTSGGALIPTMALGIPGDALMAVLMGALILHGVQPGPMLIIDFPELVYGVFLSYFVATFFMLLIMLYGIKKFVTLTKMPNYILVPVILVLCAVGSFSLQNRFFDIWVLVIFGIIGYSMSEFEFPLAPAILGLILQPLAEVNLRRALMAESDISYFLTRPISATFIILAVISLGFPFYQNWKARKKSSQ